MSVTREIAPFYFGVPDKALFGCFHVPHPGYHRDCGVVICQPVGHEYINSHRALRQLALRLADAGFPVLRFDYYGCGDSRGEDTDGDIAEWLLNISQAIFETKQRIGIPNICLIGLRLGASLAMLNASKWNRTATLVLWDPVVDGESYLQSLLSFQKEMLRFRPKPPKVNGTRSPLDILGFPMAGHLCRNIGEIDLLKISRKLAERVLLVQTEPSTSGNELRTALQGFGTSVSHECLEVPKIWLPTADGSLLVPGRVLRSITSWLSETRP